MYGENSQALRITFQPTDNCNLNCSYCYQNNKGNSELKLSDAIYFLDKLFQNDKVYFKGFYTMTILTLFWILWAESPHYVLNLLIK